MATDRVNAECRQHPGLAAVATCERCGDFLCDACLVLSGEGQSFRCQACARRHRPAPLGRRTAAFCIDFGLSCGALLVGLMLQEWWFRFTEPVRDGFLGLDRPSVHYEGWVVIWTLLSFGPVLMVWSAQLVFLARHGRGFGLTVAGLRHVWRDGSDARGAQLALVRGGSALLVWGVPGLVLIDAIVLIVSRRQSLRDRLFGTEVIRR